jgi:excisionase family DNA binding protein
LIAITYGSQRDRRTPLAPTLPFLSAEFAMETTQNLTSSPALPQLGRSVTIERAAEILGVSRRTVYYRISEGVLQTVRTRGGSQRVMVESLLGQPKH